MASWRAAVESARCTTAEPSIRTPSSASRATRRRCRWRAPTDAWRSASTPTCTRAPTGGRRAHAPHQRGVGHPLEPDAPRASTTAPIPIAGHAVGRPLGRSRAPIRPAAPSSTRTWATWRATAAETRAAPRTVRQPGEVADPADAPATAPEPPPTTFRDSRLGGGAGGRGDRCCCWSRAVVAGRLTL